MGFLSKAMIRLHRRTGDRFQGMDLVYLSTVGARTGEARQSAVARFPDGDGAWLVVASNGGANRHPGWYHNMRAHPDRVRAEVAGATTRVSVEQLEGAERDAAWRRITGEQPRFAGYQRRTDRPIPVLRLRRVS